MDPLGSGTEVQSEDDQGGEVELEQDPSNWQMSVPREILQGLTSQEIKRQEVIYGACHTLLFCIKLTLFTWIHYGGLNSK